MALVLRILGLSLCSFVIPLDFLDSSGVLSAPQPPINGNNLTINIDDHLTELYLDGVQVKDLPNADVWNIPDRIPLSDDTRVIAVLGTNGQDSALLAASDLSGRVLSDSQWKYSTVYFPNWWTVNFDDRAWNWSYVARQCNDGRRWSRFPGISRHASLIWSPNFNNFDTNDNSLYFRLRINKDYLRRDFDFVSSDEMVPKTLDCFSSRRLRCASICSQKTSRCAGFQHNVATDTCCLLSSALLEFGVRRPSAGWKIWSSVVLNETCC